jgi:hypothetical protein
MSKIHSLTVIGFAFAMTLAAAAEERKNYFNDPLEPRPTPGRNASRVKKAILANASTAP